MPAASLVAVTAIIAWRSAEGPGRAVPPVALPDTAGRMAMVAYLQSGPTMTAAQLQQIARRDAVAIAQPRKMRLYAPVLRAANPRIVLLIYRNAMFSTSVDPRSFPASWYLHSATGSIVRSARHPRNALMNPSSSAQFSWRGAVYHGWVDYVAARCAAAQVPGTSGCFLDMLGPSPLFPPYDQGGRTPIDPQTNRSYPPSIYLAMTGAVASRVRAALPHGSVVAGNGYIDGPAFARSTHALGTAIDIGEAQNWLRPDARGLPVAVWAQDVQMILSGTPVMLRYTCRCNGSAVAAERLFTVATYLLANTGHALFTFQIHGQPGPAAWSSLYGLRLGLPLRTAGSVADYLTGRVYERRFTRGIALVNPGDSPVVVNLGGRYHAPDGPAISSLRMEPHTGAVLVR